MQALRALGILYDSICGDDDGDSACAASAIGDAKDEEIFPPLPSRRAAAAPPTKWELRRSQLSIPMPPLLKSYLLDDSQILRLTSLQSPVALFDPCESPLFQSLQTTAIRTLPKQFTVPLRNPPALPAPARSSSSGEKDANPETETEKAWTLVPKDPDWVILDDGS